MNNRRKKSGQSPVTRVPLLQERERVSGYKDRVVEPVIANTNGMICIRGKWRMNEATYRKLYELGLFDLLKEAMQTQLNKV